MACPFFLSTKLLLVMGSLEDSIRLTVTAPLERILLLCHTDAIDPNGSIVKYISSSIQEDGYLHLWEGTRARIIYSVVMKKSSEYLYRWYLRSFTAFLLPAPTTTNNKKKKQEDPKEKEKAKPEDTKKKTIIQILSNFFAHSTSLLLFYPIRYAVTQVTMGNSKSIQDSVSSVSNKKDVYQGLGYTLLGAFLHHSILFGIQNYRINPFANSQRPWLRSISNIVLSQSVPEMIATWVSNPCSKMAHRIQLSSSSIKIAPESLLTTTNEFRLQGLKILSSNLVTHWYNTVNWHRLFIQIQQSKYLQFKFLK